MVMDNIKNASLYSGLGERIMKALKFLQETDFSNMEPGKVEIEGSNVFALVQKYETKPMSEGKWEAHKKYIDVQYVAEGEEKMGYTFIENLQAINKYDADGDFLLLQGDGDMLMCKRGTFAIFGPEDAHMPCIAIDNPIPVKKVVVKVKV